MKIDQKCLDMLKEVGNIGIGNSATALSKLVNKPVSINIPETRLYRLNEFSALAGGPDTFITSVYVEIQGELSGQSLFTLNDVSAKKFCDVVLGKDGATTTIGEMELSLLNETANIIVGVYLTSIGNLAGLKVLPGLPVMTHDLAQAIMDQVIVEYSSRVDEILAVKAEIKIESVKVDGVFLLVLDQPSMEKLVAHISQKYQI